ncbi:MAG: ACP S-malonyltransferase [Deltaproteobacteria bacterium]|nr:ACP S-malonyltransferase [Deltaproteobacteria bacterium]
MKRKEKICFCFPGQLQERPHLPPSHPFYGDGAAQEIYEETLWFSGFDVLNFSFKEGEWEPYLNVKLQLSSYVISLIHYYRLQREGIFPHVIAEHSMGIYAALAASESIDFREGLLLTRDIGFLIEKRARKIGGAMCLVLGLEMGQIEGIRDQLDGYRISIANYNGSRNFVLSGLQDGIDRIISLSLDMGAIAAHPLTFTAPLHCDLMEPVRAEIQGLVDRIEVKKPRVPVLNHMGLSFLKKEDIKPFLAEELCRPVYWEGCVKELLGRGVTWFIEVGYDATLCKLIRWIDREIRTTATEDPISLES